MNDRLSIFLICLMLTAISGSMNAQQNQTQDLPLPAIPATLRTPHERASYLLAHFWDSMSFADTLRSRNPGFMEQNLVNYLSLFPHAPAEARTEAVVSEVAPESVMNLIENVETTGNIYGVEKPSYGQDGTDVLVYIGEVAAIKVPEMAKHLLALLAKAGVSAKVLANEPASGVMLGDLMGYTEEVRKQAEVCAKALNETKLPVVVLDSYDAEIMTQKYPEWGCEITAGVTTATAFVAKLLEEKKLAAKAALGTLGACHDDDRLARTFHEFAPVRSIAKAAGYELTEMFNHEKLAKSCGTAVAYGYMPELVTRIAGGRWDDLTRTDAKAMLVACPETWLCFSLCVPEGYQLVDLFGALL